MSRKHRTATGMTAIVAFLFLGLGLSTVVLTGNWIVEGDFAGHGPMHFAAVGTYGVTALLCGLWLWRLSPLCRFAFAGWCASWFAYFFLLPGLPTLTYVPGLCVALLVSALVYRWLSRVTQVHRSGVEPTVAK